VFAVGGRVPLEVGRPYAGVLCEVDTINSALVQFGVLAKVAAAEQAEGAEAIVALTKLYDLFATLARPTWNLVDATGNLPPTAAGMFRVPVPLMLTLIGLWVDTLPEPDPVDEMRADIERRAAAMEEAG
jgi:hypothetical protein